MAGLGFVFVLLGYLFAGGSNPAQAQIRFTETGAPNSKYVSLQAPASIPANLQWILPSSDGSANQCLATDGSGTLIWRSSASSNSLDASDGSPTNALFVDANGNVGIGTTSPSNLLSLSGSGVQFSISNPVTTGYSQMALTGTGRTYQVGVGNASEATYGVANKWFVYDNSAGMRMVLDSSGNVGMGTIAPFSPLHVYRAISGAAPSNSGTADANVLERIQSNNVAFDIGMTVPGDVWLQPRTSNDLSVNNKLLLNPNGGNVGIGTTSPSGLLSVGATSQFKVDSSGNITAPGVVSSLAGLVTGGSGTQYTIRRNVDDNLLNIAGGSSSVLGGNIILNGSTSATNPNVIRFRNSSTEAMRIDASGNVGIGTASPSAKLEVAGQSRSINSSGVAQSNGSASVDWNNGNAQTMSVACTTTSFTNMLDGGTYILAVSETGTTTCTFSQAGLTFYFSPANGARTSGQRTVYTFQRIGSDVYVSWIKGFQ